MDCSAPGSSIHGIFQARILEWVAISFSRGSSGPRNWTRISCIAGGFFNQPSYEESPNCTGWGGIFSQLLNSSSSDLTYLFIELLFIYREGQKSTEILKPKDNLNIRSEIWLNKFVERNLSPGLNSVLPWPHIFIFCWAGTQVKAYPIKRELNGLM